MSYLYRSLLGASVMLAVCCAGSAPAEAFDYFVAGGEVKAPEVKPLKEQTPATTKAKITSKPLAVNSNVQCTSRKITGSLLPGGSSTLMEELTSCTELSAQLKGKCGVKVPITLSFNGAIESKAPGAIGLEGSGIGQLVSELTWEGVACPVKGTYKFTGTQGCGVVNFEKEENGHEVECLPAGSKLSLGGRVATYETAPVSLELEPVATWSAK